MANWSTSGTVMSGNETSSDKCQSENAVEQMWMQARGGGGILLELPLDRRNWQKAALIKPFQCSKLPRRDVRFEVLTAVTMKNAVFWDVTLCGSCKKRRFGGTYRLHHQEVYVSPNVGSYKNHTV
jgi:hypothetical protein